MRPRARLLAGYVALCGLLSGALSAAPGFAAEARSLPLAPERCRNEAPPARVHKGLVPAQQEFGAEAVWRITAGAGATVAVLGSGVDASHPQMKGENIATGADFLNRAGGGSGKENCDGHGTAVISLIAARPAAGVQFRGMAYQAKVLPIVVAADQDQRAEERRVTTPDRYAKAIEWAVAQGATVIVASVPLYEDHPSVKRAVNKAISSDVLVVAAVGDGAVKANPSKGIRASPGEEPYPAGYDQVLGVAGLDGSGVPLEASQYGDYVDLAAPGDAIVANRGSGHTSISSTAAAAAFVGAAAALVRARQPEMGAPEVTRRLLATTTPAAGSRERVGAGMVDPYWALTERLSDEKPVEAAGLRPESPDPATVAREKEWTFNGAIGLIAGVFGVLTAGGLLAGLSLIPRGVRRRWRPGRAKPFSEPEEDELPPAPRKLFEDLETS